MHKKNLLLAAVLSLTLASPVFAGPDKAAAASDSRAVLICRDVRTDSGSITLTFSGSQNLDFRNSPDPAVTVTPEVMGGHMITRGHRSIVISGDFKPEVMYTIQIAKDSLVSGDGTTPKRDVFIQVKIPEGTHYLSFATDGKYFPIHANNFSLPVISRNVREMNVSLWRLYDVNFDFNRNFNPHGVSDYGEPLAEKKIAVPSGPGEKTFSLELEDLIGKKEPGVYGLMIEDKALDDGDWNSYWSRRDSRFLIVTDLVGIMAMDPEERTMDVFVHSIASGKPVDGAQVRVFSRKNQTVAEGVTKNGIARLRFNGSYTPDHDPVNRCVVRYGKDATILMISPYYGSLTLSGNSGYKEGKGCCAFAYTERGVVRPGETFHASAFLRQKNEKGTWEPVQGAPVRLMLKEPSGKILAEKKAVSGQEGFVSEPFTLPENARTGEYRVLWGLSPEQVFGECSITAAAYMPDRIRVKLTASQAEANPGMTIDFTTQAKYYFGGDVPDSAAWKFTVQPGKHKLPDFWRGWTVDNPDRYVKAYHKSFSRSGSNDLPKKICWEIQKDEDWTLPVQFIASLSVTEPGGRSVTGFAHVLVDPFESYIGIRRGADSGIPTLEFALLPGKKGAAVKAEEVEISLTRRKWEYVLIQRSSDYIRDWECIEIPVKGILPEKVRLTAEPTSIPLAKLESGFYVVSARINGRETSFSFFHEYGETGRRSMDPRVLTLTTDKEKYEPGETAKLELDVPANSFAMIVHGETGAEQTFRKDFAEGGLQIVDIPIRADMNSEAWHGTVTLVSRAENGDYLRKFAFFTLKVDMDRNRLVPVLNAPDVLRPGDTLNGEVRLADPSGNPKGGLVHIFAVDEGILALTDFRTPDIFNAVFGPRLWNVQITDIYEMIYPDLKFLPDGTIGGGEGAALAKRLEPIRQKAPAIVVPPPVSVPESGVAQWSFKLPDHTGALRIMAVAVSGQSAGSSDKQLLLRDEAIAMISLPRTVSPGDEFDVTVTVNNMELPEDDEITVDVEVPSFLTLKDPPEWKVRVPRKSSSSKAFRCIAGDRVGSGDIRVRLRGGTVDRVREEPITIRTGSVLKRHLEVRLLEPGSTLEFPFADPAWKQAEHTLSIMGNPASGAAFALDYLSKYPYGCTEQRTSCAFPYLATPDLIKAGLLDPRGEGTAADRLEAASAELLSMIRNNGSFPMWQGGTIVWEEASVYASLFFFEAQARGILRTDPDLLRRMQLYLTSLLQDGTLKKKRMLLASACYALAVSSDDAFLTPARNLLAEDPPDFASLVAALAMIRGGYAAEGAAYLNERMDAGVWLSPESMFSCSGDKASFGMLLSLLLENAPDDKRIPSVAERLLAELKHGSKAWGSTQSNAWAARGLAAFAARFPAKPYRIRLDGPGGTRYLEEKGEIRLKSDEKIRLTNEGEGAALIRMETEGIPSVLRKAEGPIQITRSYLASNGYPVSKVNHGDLLTVELSLYCPCDVKGAVLCCLLPAGLEIEDSSLATRAKSSTVFSNNLSIQNVERRDDRFLVFFHAAKGRSEIHFTVRATTRGVFSDPPCTVERMYDPETFGTLFGTEPLIVK